MAANEQHGPITSEQIAFYEAFGFLLRRQALSRTEMNSIEDAFETLMLESRNGEPFDGQEHQAVQNLIEHRSDFKSLMPSFNNAAEQLLGSGFIFAGTSMNLFVGDTGWHADLGWHNSMLGGRKPPPPGPNSPASRSGTTTETSSTTCASGTRRRRCCMGCACSDSARAGA